MPATVKEAAHGAGYRPARHGRARAEHGGQAAGAVDREARRGVPAAPAGEGSGAV